MEQHIFSVTELNRYIKGFFDLDETLAHVYIRGELSNYKMYPSGHHYFTLKDAEGALKCVMFKREASKLLFRPENGMGVIACGRITVYPRDGLYQLYCEELTPEGAGSLYIAFEQLKDKLFKEGLFDPAHKKPLPPFPMRIAIVTSSAGAAVRDMIRILGQRSPMTKVLLLPVRVQGEEAPAEIAGALRYANRHQLADLIITGRGGGSIEDLWAFNDERVARAIYESELPVISAVGHEPDVTIADFVADLRASTPSNAAELAVQDVRELYARLDHSGDVLRHALDQKLALGRERVAALAAKRVMRDPMAYVEEKRMTLDRTVSALSAAAERSLSGNRNKFIHLSATLDALSPLKVLSRGYSIARLEDGTLLKQRAQARVGDALRIDLSDGGIDCRITAVDPATEV